MKKRNTFGSSWSSLYIKDVYKLLSILYLRGFVDSLEGIFIHFSSSHCFCFFLHDILVFLLFFGLLFDSILLSYYFTALILVYFWMFQDIVLSSWLMVISHYFMIILLTCLLWLNVISLCSLRVFSFAGIVGICILLPINYLGDQLSIDFSDLPSKSLDVFSISNVKNGSKWYCTARPFFFCSS